MWLNRGGAVVVPAFDGTVDDLDADFLEADEGDDDVTGGVWEDDCECACDGEAGDFGSAIPPSLPSLSLRASFDSFLLPLFPFFADDELLLPLASATTSMSRLI